MLSSTGALVAARLLGQQSGGAVQQVRGSAVCSLGECVLAACASCPCVCTPFSRSRWIADNLISITTRTAGHDGERGGHAGAAFDQVSCREPQKRKKTADRFSPPSLPGLSPLHRAGMRQTIRTPHHRIESAAAGKGKGRGRFPDSRRRNGARSIAHARTLRLSPPLHTLHTLHTLRATRSRSRSRSPTNKQTTPTNKQQTTACRPRPAPTRSSASTSGPPTRAWPSWRARRRA